MQKCPAICARRSVGFTFVEVMIVVIVIGITAALAVPMLMETDDTKLISAADLIVADLAYAQVESISHGDDPRVVVFDTTNHKYIITTRSAITTAVGAGDEPIDATPITNPVGNEPFEVTFGQRHAMALNGVQISTLSLDGDDELEFGIYGQTDQSADASITLTAGSNNIDVTVDPVSGEASIGTIY